MRFTCLCHTAIICAVDFLGSVCVDAAEHHMVSRAPAERHHPGWSPHPGACSNDTVQLDTAEGMRLGFSLAVK